MFTPEQIKEFVESNPKLVLRKESKRHPGLFVLKYHNRVFYDNLWCPELTEMRGLVVDKDYRVIVLPFTKIFNRLENGVDIDRDEIVTAVRKVNGFMGAATFDSKYGFMVSTTGSLDSDFVTLAEIHLAHMKQFFVPDVTYLFEIVDPTDPHIIKENYGAYIIGARNTQTGYSYTPKECAELGKNLHNAGFTDIEIPEIYNEVRFSDVVQMTKECSHEGFVVYGKNITLKIKSPYYLTKKLFARIKAERVNTQWLMDNKQKLDEEYYPLVDYINDHRIKFISLSEQERLTFIEEFLEK